jgi:hypothetical protein
MTSEAKQHDERIRTTNDGEFNAEKHDDGIGMTNDGEFNAEKHDDGIGMTNDGEFNAEQHQKLTAGSKASGALDPQQLKKEVIRATTLPSEMAHGATWFASDRCCDDEPRDGIG